LLQISAQEENGKTQEFMGKENGQFRRLQLNLWKFCFRFTPGRPENRLLEDRRIARNKQ
jgi:hypothetical protein